MSNDRLQKEGFGLLELMIALAIMSAGFLGIAKLIEEVTAVSKATENKTGAIEIEAYHLKLMKKFVKPTRYEEFDPALTGRYVNSQFQIQSIDGSPRWAHYTGAPKYFSYEGENNLVQDISTYLISSIKTNASGVVERKQEGVLISRCVPASHTDLPRDFKSLYNLPRTLILNDGYKCCEASLSACRLTTTEIPMTFVFRRSGARKLPLQAEYHLVAGHGFSLFFDNQVNASPGNIVVKTASFRNKCTTKSVGGKKDCYSYLPTQYDESKFKDTYEYSTYEYSVQLLPDISDTTFLPI